MIIEFIYAFVKWHLGLFGLGNIYDVVVQLMEPVKVCTQPDIFKNNKEKYWTFIERDKKGVGVRSGWLLNPVIETIDKVANVVGETINKYNNK